MQRLHPHLFIMVVWLALGEGCATATLAHGSGDREVLASSKKSEPGQIETMIPATRPVAKNLDGTEHADWLLAVPEQMFIDVVGKAVFDACTAELALADGVCTVWLDGGCINASMDRKESRLVLSGRTCRARIHELQPASFCPRGDSCRPLVSP